MGVDQGYTVPSCRGRQILEQRENGGFAGSEGIEGKMSLLVKTLAPIVAGFMIALSAEAQLLPTWETHITLTQQDLDMIRNAVTNQVHGKPVGTNASWSNPTSGNSGSVKLLKKLARKGQQCEDIAYTVRSGGPPGYTEHYRFISCMQPDGTWKIA
jgi:surface antigen